VAALGRYNRKRRRPRTARRNELRGVLLADFTTGRASVFPHRLERSVTGCAWSLLRAICRLNPNLALAPLGKTWVSPGFRQTADARRGGRPVADGVGYRRRLNMARRSIYITRQDANRLQEWLRISRRRHEKDRENLDVLERELERAHLIEPDAVPGDVVTMHSQVRLMDPATRQELQCTLVFPEDAVARHERVSVLAPLGAAILGCRAGDEIRFQVPGGARTVRVLQVLYQPEAAGHFHL
jgi:regulator of nucleoside diphosphate kinase